VFLKPLESLLGLSRADLALVFAVSAAGFGAGMNLAPHVFGLASTPVLVLACAAASTVGVGLAATAGGLAQLAMGTACCSAPAAAPLTSWCSRR